jgi:cobalt-zinc-cadmium efflux system outer membrane protein
MKRIAKVVLFILAVVPVLGAGRADESILTLEECLSLAARSSPDILRAEQALEAARGRRLQSGAWTNPELVMSAEGLPLERNAGEKEVSVGLQQLFEFPGKLALRRTAGRYEEDAAALDLERVRTVVEARVKQAYYTAAASARRLDLLGSALKDLESYSELARAKYAALQTSSVDVSRGMIEMLKVRVEAVQARQELGSNLAALYQVLGLPVTDTAPRLEELRFVPLALSLDDVLGRARSRPSLKAAGLRESRAETGVRLARKSNLPDFTLGLFYPSLRTAGWGVALETSIPLFWSGHRGEVREAEALLEEAGIIRRARLARIETAVRSVYSDLALLREKLALYNDSLLGEADRLIQSALRDYQYGRLDSLGLLDFFRSWREVNLDYLQTVLSYARASAELDVAGEESGGQE